MPDKVVIQERRRRPTVGLTVGERNMNILSWSGLLAIAAGISVLYAGAQTIGTITGITFNSKTSQQIDKLTELVKQEAETRAAADNESRADRTFIRAQVGDLTLAVCGALTSQASRVVRERCDKILTNSYSRP